MFAAGSKLGYVSTMPKKQRTWAPIEDRDNITRITEATSLCRRTVERWYWRTRSAKCVSRAGLANTERIAEEARKLGIERPAKRAPVKAKRAKRQQVAS